MGCRKSPTTGCGAYGAELIERLSMDLTGRFGRGFSQRNLEQMRQFYLGWPIAQALSAQLPGNTVAEPESRPILAAPFPRPWSHDRQLLAVRDEDAHRFYEVEALRGVWSVRQLNRQIGSQFYERTLLSKNKAAMLRKGSVAQARDLVAPEEKIKDPLLLEFLNLKDEFSEFELEEALIHRLEDFLTPTQSQRDRKSRELGQYGSKGCAAPECTDGRNLLVAGQCAAYGGGSPSRSFGTEGIPTCRLG